MDNALYDWLKTSDGIFLCGASLVRVGVTSCVYEVGSSARVCCTTVDQSHGVCFCGFPLEVGRGGHCCWWRTLCECVGFSTVLLEASCLTSQKCFSSFVRKVTIFLSQLRVNGAV